MHGGGSGFEPPWLHPQLCGILIQVEVLSQSSDDTRWRIHRMPIEVSDSEGGGRELPVAEGDTGPPGPIPNPVVKRVSADGYCGSNAVGDVAAAGNSRP